MFQARPQYGLYHPHLSQPKQGRKDRPSLNQAWWNRLRPSQPWLFKSLKDISDNGHEMSLDTLLSIFFLHLEDAGASLFLGDTGTADAGSLALSHARVDIDILDSDEKWSVFWSDEPAVDLPHQVKEDDQGTGEVELEEGIGIQVRTADWIQGDVELGHEGNNGDEDADIGAPDATRGSEGELVQGVTVVLPVNG